LFSFSFSFCIFEIGPGLELLIFLSVGITGMSHHAGFSKFSSKSFTVSRWVYLALTFVRVIVRVQLQSVPRGHPPFVGKAIFPPGLPVKII
jgi:hypothetical protein